VIVVVDTSVWIDHLHEPSATLADLLTRNLVAGHPLVTEELALGFIRNRAETLYLLRGLIQVDDVTHEQMMALIEANKLWGHGLSVVDVHLFASVVEHGSAQLWTRDKRLHKAAEESGVAFVE